VIALLPKVWVGTIANGKHTAVTGYFGVGANVNLSRNAFECITRHTCIAKIATLIRYIFNWPWVKENKGKNRVRLKQNTITKYMEKVTKWYFSRQLAVFPPSRRPLLPYQSLIFRWESYWTNFVFFFFLENGFTAFFLQN